MPRVLITGATGFLGSAIAQECVRSGFLVRATGRAARPPLSLPDYTPADLQHPDTLPALLVDVDSVVHAAGLAHQFGKAHHDRSRFMAINAEGTERIVRAAADAGVKHFVLISSVSVYGGSVANEDAPCFPQGPYAESKYQAEQRAIGIAEARGMHLTVLRLATIYGEGDPGNIARLIRAIDGHRFIWIGAGTNRKSLIHRADAARACVTVLQHVGHDIRIYNVSAPPCTMRDVVEGLAAALNRSVPPWHVPAPPVLAVTSFAAQLFGGRGLLGGLPAAVDKWLADDVYPALRFEQTFHYQPQIVLLDGLRREVAWYRGQDVGR